MTLSNESAAPAAWRSFSDCPVVPLPQAVPWRSKRLREYLNASFPYSTDHYRPLFLPRTRVALLVPRIGIGTERGNPIPALYLERGPATPRSPGQHMAAFQTYRGVEGYRLRGGVVVGCVLAETTVGETVPVPRRSRERRCFLPSPPLPGRAAAAALVLSVAITAVTALAHGAAATDTAAAPLESPPEGVTVTPGRTEVLTALRTVGAGNTGLRMERLVVTPAGYELHLFGTADPATLRALSHRLQPAQITVERNAEETTLRVEAGR